MTLAAYCRVSTDKAEQLESLQHQKEFFTAYARQNGHVLYRLYADEGISGTSLKKREEFKHLMADAEAGKFQLVVVKDVSRFARNTVDALQSIRTLKAMGIHTIFLTANMDSMGDSEFILTLFSAMAQEESNSLSKRVKWGKRINAEKGRVPQRIFGYHRVDNFTLEIHPEEAETVRKIYSLYVNQGLGCRSISQVLNRDGDCTKLGGQWNSAGVRRILVNPLYCGILVNHKYEVTDFLTGKQALLPEEARFSHPRPDWAIIPEETFRTAQEILSARRVQYDSGEPFRQGRYSSKHAFSTLIKCAHCGRSFCRKTYTYQNIRVYWHCAANDREGIRGCDNRVSVGEPELMEVIRNFCEAQIRDRTRFAARVTRQLQQECSGTDPSAEKKSAEAKHNRLRAKQERYRELYSNGFLTMEQLKEKYAAVEEELQAAAGSESSSVDDIRERWQEEIRMFPRVEDFTNVQMRLLIRRILVDRDGTVEILLNVPEG